MPYSYYCTPYLLTIATTQSNQCVEDGYDCFLCNFPSEGSPPYYLGTQYCTSGYTLYTENLQCQTIQYRSDGIGDYYLTYYCVPDNFINIYFPWGGSGSYNNGYVGYLDNGTGLCTYVELYCESGYTFMNQINIGSGFFCNITGCYYCSATSDGAGNYFWQDIYLNGTFLSCDPTILCISEIDSCFGNGFNCGISNEYLYPRICYFYNYCQSGFYFVSGSGSDGSFSDATGQYCFSVVSDGTGYYSFLKTYFSGVVLSCLPVCINILNQYFNNGYSGHISNGSGSCFTYANYCQYNHEFFSSGCRSYMSDASGGYFVYRDAKLNFVNISWDFSEESKNKYFNLISVSGDFLQVSLNDSKNFYDIVSYENSIISINEADSCCSINLYNTRYPFIFLKNSGPCNLCLIASSGEEMYNFYTGKNSIKENHSGINYELNSGESLFLHINANLDGSKYLSKSCYAFGFYYNFSNVNCYNEYGEFPACCNNLNEPLYIYECIFDYPLNNCSDNYLNEIRSFGFLNYVDSGVNLNLKLNKNVYSGDVLFCSNLINKIYSFCTSHGLDNYKSRVQINNLDLKINGERICCFTGIENINLLDLQVDRDLCINIMYDIDLQTEYEYNYMYCYSGDLTSSIQKIYSGSQVLKFNESECLIPDYLYCYNSDSNEQYICVELNDCYSIKSIFTNLVCRDNLYLPVKSEFNQNYLYKIKKSSFLPIMETGDLSGYWNSDLSENFDYFVNSINLINCTDQNFINYKPEIYSINLNYSESRFCSDCVVQYSNSDTGDDFELIFENSEKEFVYSGITFKYNPASCIYYMGNYYEIPDSNIEYTANLSGNQSIFNFPLRAVNKDKIKIITSFENFELVNFSNACLNYNDLNFCITCCNSNYMTFNIPRINSGSGNCYYLESPSIEINLNKNDILQKNLNIYINPLNTICCTFGYGLNDFILFLKSELTSGIIHFENYSSLIYGDSEYNFLFLDLKAEANNKKIGEPTGQWVLLDSKKTFENNSENPFFSIKSKNGNGYNYITYAVTGFSYCDAFVDFSGNNQINLTGNTNLIHSSFASNYYAGSYCTGLESGLSGNLFTGYNCDSIFLYNNNNIYISYTKEAISSTSSGRDVYFNKKSTYSGVQPIFIQTNYPLLDIKYPIVYSNLELFCKNPTDENINSTFYYVYNLNNFYSTSLKFLSPEGTTINTICWVDSDEDNNIVCYLDSAFCKGNINKNAASVSANIDVNNNGYTYDETKNYSFCINIIGDI